MSEVQVAGLRDPDMQRALANHLRVLEEAKKHPNPERDLEQWRRLVKWVTSRIDASENPGAHADELRVETGPLSGYILSRKPYPSTPDS